MGMEGRHGETGKEGSLVELTGLGQTTTIGAYQMTSTFDPIRTADRHRHLAKRLRIKSGKPGWPSKEYAETLAQQHETVAKMHNDRLRQEAAARLA
jgi:hypothetical protein